MDVSKTKGGKEGRQREKLRGPKQSSLTVTISGVGRRPHSPRKQAAKNTMPPVQRTEERESLPLLRGILPRLETRPRFCCVECGCASVRPRRRVTVRESENHPPPLTSTITKASTTTTTTATTITPQHTPPRHPPPPPPQQQQEEEEEQEQQQPQQPVVSPKRAHCFVASLFLMDPSAAQRRRQRRLRSMLRHERVTVANGPGREVAPLLTRTEDGQGRGGGERDEVYGQVPDDSSFPGRCSSVCTKKSPAGGGLPAWQSRRGHRSGSSGTPWSTSLTWCVSLPWCRSSMHLCRRRGICCRTSCLSSVRSCLIPSRLSRCPRSCSMMSLCELLSVTRSW